MVISLMRTGKYTVSIFTCNSNMLCEWKTLKVEARLS